MAFEELEALGTIKLMVLYTFIKLTFPSGSLDFCSLNVLHEGLNSHYKTWSYSKRGQRGKHTGKLIKITLMVSNAKLKIVQIINQKKIKNSRVLQHKEQNS